MKFTISIEVADVVDLDRVRTLLQDAEDAVCDTLIEAGLTADLGVEVGVDNLPPAKSSAERNAEITAEMDAWHAMRDANPCPHTKPMRGGLIRHCVFEAEHKGRCYFESPRAVQERAGLA